MMFERKSQRRKSWPVCAILFLHILLNFFESDAQIDPNFPLVTVPDANPVIGPAVQKVYVTTVGLVPTTTNSRFVSSTFKSAAEQFYSSTVSLAGYVDIPLDSITSNQVNPSLIQVTYNVVYNFETMRTTSGGVDDNQIQNTLGNYDMISATIGSPSYALFSFYTFEPNGPNFQFTGQSICSQDGVTCNGTTQCVETLAGVSITCRSPCKQGYCYNNGTCAQSDEFVNPTCTCLSSSDVWFLGEQCQTMVSLWMVILIVVACVIVIIIAIVLACCFYKSKRRKKEKNDHIHDVSARSNAAGAYLNSAYLRNEEPKKEAHATAQNGFKPRLEPRADPIVFRNPSTVSQDRRRRRSLSSERRSRRNQSSRNRTASSSPESNSSVSSYSEHSSNEYSSEDDQPNNSPHQRRSQTSSDASSSDPDPRSTTTDPQEFGDEENDVDITTRDQGTSPIRWVPTTKAPGGKIDIADRKGWLPSLGPQMFNLGSPVGANQTANSVTLPAPSLHITDTDI